MKGTDMEESAIDRALVYWRGVLAQAERYGNDTRTFTATIEKLEKQQREIAALAASKTVDSYTDWSFALPEQPVIAALEIKRAEWPKFLTTDYGRGGSCDEPDCVMCAAEARGVVDRWAALPETNPFTQVDETNVVDEEALLRDLLAKRGLVAVKPGDVKDNPGEVIMTFEQWQDQLPEAPANNTPRGLLVETPLMGWRMGTAPWVPME